MRNTSTWAPSPRSPATWPPESFRVVPTLAAAFGAILVTLVAVGGYVAYALTTGVLNPRHPENLPPEQVLITQIIAYLPLALYLIAVIPPLARVPAERLGFRTPTASQVLIAVLATAVMWIAVIGSSAAIETLTHRHDTEAAMALLRSIHTPLEKLSFVAVAVVFAPLVEELAFRVFAFNALWRWTNSAGVAAVLSGILFGLVHALGASPSQLLTIALPLALGGIVLAAVYAWTRCYWTSVLTHALFNSITVVAYFVFGARA